MATNRKLVFANNEIYHVFNRGVEKRQTFTQKREFMRATQLLQYYRFINTPIRFSHVIRLTQDRQKQIFDNLLSLDKHVEILSYCLMPNHFHFLLRQTHEYGISQFIANFTNSYTKYFNTKHSRVGHLFQGLFKAVHIDDDEQLIHISRYIHLNPATSFIVEPELLHTYQWSSYPTYLSLRNSNEVETQTVLGLFKNKDQYKEFVLDQATYARNLDKIKHLILE